MSDAEKTVFISYRRNVGSYIARAIFLDLRANGYDVFMDVESIDSGPFDTIILNQIEARGHFLVLLMPGAVERCAEPDDWLRHEIEYAIDKQRNIVPVLVNGFTLAGTEPFLTGKLSGLHRYNGLVLYHDYFDAGMDKLRNRFLKQPIYGKVVPTPVIEQPVVEQKIEEVANQPAPTEEQLSAEEYFNRAYAKAQAEDREGAIADYDQAIRLNPQLAVAYYNRGITRYNKRDVDGAIADYDQAIRLNPRYADAYNNRGLARYSTGNVDTAMADYVQAIRLNPHLAGAHNNRGIARFKKGDVDGAIADYDQAIRLNPQLAQAHCNRGIARLSKDDLDGAIADYDQAIRLNPRYGDAYNNRAEAYFAAHQYDLALADFQQANNLFPAENMIMAGIGITHHALGQPNEAKRLWKMLLILDARYRDADWVGKELNWAAPLVEEARRLIAKL
jgi:tetratricopeptide (TPR) repeat protein